MKRLVLMTSFIGIAATMLFSPVEVDAQRRAVVVRRPVALRHPVARTRIFVRPGHPLRRTLPSTVIVRPAQKVVTVGSPLVFLPPLAWERHNAIMPGSERLVWEDSETIEKEEGWVDANFGVDSMGYALLLQIDGKSKLNFAEIVFMNGNVQVVDFDEKTSGAGIYKLLDFPNGRHVSTVRILAKSESDESQLVVYLSR